MDISNHRAVASVSRPSHRHWDSNYMLLMKSQLPITNTVSFIRDRNTNKIDWTSPVNGLEYPPENILGYRVGCSGDSGSGQVFSTYVNEPRFVIAAVLKGGFSDKVRDTEGNVVNMPCGAYTIDDPNYNILETVHHSQKISWPEIFDWIKDNLNK